MLDNVSGSTHGQNNAVRREEVQFEQELNVLGVR